MKRILITGANSYIGTSFEKWVAQWPAEYYVDTVGTRNGEWKELDFSIYNVILHVAGIAHIKETKENQHLYYLVNRDLAIDVAKKAKVEGVKQFIFLSSMSVYGVEKGIITSNTIPKPKNSYGKSKFEAELSIEKMNSNEFSVAILRPPMIYGKNCKGNYQTLSKFAKITPIFPSIDNERSMLYIDNLSEFIKYTIDSKQQGVFCPQNIEYVSTKKMMSEIALNSNNKIINFSFLNGFIKILGKQIPKLNKIFGNLVYEKSHFQTLNTFIEFEESIVKTER